MQQHVSNETPQNTPETRSAFERAQAFVTRTLALILHQATQTRSLTLYHARHLKPAPVVIALFLAMTFTLTVRSGIRSQALTTATLPIKEQAVAKADTAASISESKPDTAAEAPRYIAGSQLKRMTPLSPEKVDSETLWLARVIYSETKRPEEQEIVAWVIRNRVETEYRGKDTYAEVVNDPYQFSAFNPGTSTRARYASLTENSRTPGFQKALAIANQVRHAPDSVRPFPETTRHFYSPQSMVGGRTPSWARTGSPVKPARDFTLESKRFRFYEDVG